MFETREFYIVYVVYRIRNWLIGQIDGVAKRGTSGAALRVYFALEPRCQHCAKFQFRPVV